MEKLCQLRIKTDQTLSEDLRGPQIVKRLENCAPHLTGLMRDWHASLTNFAAIARKRRKTALKITRSITGQNR